MSLSCPGGARSNRVKRRTVHLVLASRLQAIANLKIVFLLFLVLVFINNIILLLCASSVASSRFRLAFLLSRLNVVVP